MTNMVRKATNTVAVKMVSKNMLTELFDKCTLDYFKKKYYEGFYVEHYNAAKSIIQVFVNLAMHHVILHAPTQSGKTTVMTMLYNLINESESFLTIKKYLGIKKVIYLTGDNQFELSEQSMDRFRCQCHLPQPPIRISGSLPCKIDDFITLEKQWSKSNKTPFIMIKNGDCKSLKNVKGFTLDNTLIMVDESHYGTKDIRSQVNQLLQEFGKDFSGDPDKLMKNKTYILSVSATPYNEEFADKVNNGDDLMKGIIHYTPGKGYIGFAKLHKDGMVEGLKDNSDVKEKAKFTKFMKEQRAKMDTIFEETNGQRHAVIMRMQGKKTLITELGQKELAKIADKYGFHLMIVDCKNTSKRNIDYDNAYKEIEYSQYDGGKNILIVVKQGFSYGISIPDEVKPLISTIYDFRPSFSNTTTDSTEQGLLGRMTGYHPNGISKYLKIYISEEHLEALYDYHCKFPPSESPMPSKKKGGKVECTIEEWDGTVQHVELWNNDERKPLIFSGKVVDKFFENHPEFHYNELFNSERAAIGTIAPIAEAFNKEVLGGRFKTKLADARRLTNKDSQSDHIAENLGFVTPILSNASRLGWKKDFIVNPKPHTEGWECVVDIRKAKGKKGIEIRIPWGYIGFSKDVKEYKQRKNYKGYQKVDIPEYVLAAQD